MQCSGTTKESKRCTRQVKVAPFALANTHPDVEIEKWCHQHAKVLLDNAGFFSHKATDEWVKFEGVCPFIFNSERRMELGS